MKQLRFALAVGLVAVGVAVFAVGAGGSPDDRWFTGINLHFTGPTTTAGTFVMSGAVDDSGTSTVSNLALAPIGNSGLMRLSGDQTYVGSKGTIVTRFEGQAFGELPHQVGRGRIEIVSGTGAYAGLEGRARFLIVVDAASNQLIGTSAGSVVRG
jgi:hypothetical protein